MVKQYTFGRNAEVRITSRRERREGLLEISFPGTSAAPDNIITWYAEGMRVLGGCEPLAREVPAGWDDAFTGWLDILGAQAETEEAGHDRNALKQRIIDWLCQNTGSDSEDVSRHFDISGGLALELVDELIEEGRISYDE
jgi:hypothetical protein